MKRVNTEVAGNARVTNTLPVHAVLLKPGRWKQQFTGEQSKLIVAEALNLCIYHKGLHVAGYLITETSLYLILKIHREELNRLLAVFYDTLRKLIKQYQHVFMPGEIYTDADSHAGEMFTQHPVRNCKLTSLITGLDVTLPYHDPYLAWLKKSLHHYNYCSIIDYEGGRGPVKVSLL